MKFRHRAGVCALALAAGMAALQVEPAVIRNLSFETASGRVSIGAVKVPLWSAALAQGADSFSLENVSFTRGSATYELKRIDLSGVTSSRAEIEALFGAGSTEPMAARLAKINAKRIEIPEAKVKLTLPAETQTTTYRNTVLSDIVAGRVASATFETAAVEISNKDATILASVGKSSINDLDVGALAGLYEAKAKTSSEPMTRIYGAFAIDNIDVTDTKGTFAFKFARLNGRDFLARPTLESWTGTESILSELSGKDTLSDEETSRLFTLVADMINAFQIGHVEATGIEMKNLVPDPARKGTAPATGRIQRMAYASGSGQQPADMRIEGFEVVESKSTVKIGTMALTGFSIAPTLDGLKNLQGKKIEELDTATLRTLIPTLGTLRLSGIDVDAMSKSEEGKQPERAKLTVEDFALTGDKPLNGIPTNFRIEQRNATFALPAESSDELVQQLLALGYKSVTSSFTVAANWNEAASEIAVSEVSLQGQEIGGLMLTGLIGNVSKDLFSTDDATAAAAAINLKAKQAHVVIEDKGLLDRYLTQAAKDQKTKPEALRKLYAGAAPLVLSSMIGSSEQVSILAEAISKFIAKPGKLTIDATPKNPTGFGFMDAVLAPEPADMLEKLNISAKAE
ncbi:hypothetical protein AB4Y85_13705 [Microvirga sp. 2YAF29]|uniref:hypothetical protein n=1 Tax=Microvirga sp. 2YAF29 TaxID=3233031 RepID=UPI003F96857B